MTDAHVKQVYSVVAEVTDDIQLPYNEFSIASTSAVQHYRAQHRETEASRPPCLSCLVNTRCKNSANIVTMEAVL